MVVLSKCFCWIFETQELSIKRWVRKSSSFQFCSRDLINILLYRIQFEISPKLLKLSFSVSSFPDIQITFMTFMKIEKALINDPLRVSKVFRKCRIPTIYNFAAIYPCYFLFFLKNSLLFNSLYCLFWS